jgi:hypothetical protein
MTLGQTTVVAMGFVSALAVGIWISPFVLGPDVDAAGAESVGATAAAATPADPTPAAEPIATIAAVPVDEPALQARLKPLLTRGADMTIAADGFDNAEQFAAVAHAAHNTSIPFMLLKHRVLEEGKSLDEAIRESKPDLDAAIEADRARAEARSVVASLRG